MKKAVKLSVIILNYRTPEITVRAFKSLDKAASNLEIEKIIVDNGSRDGSVEFIRERAPSARIIELPENRGFAAGMNAGARAASGDYILFMNSDVEAFPGSLNILVDYLEANPDTGVVGPLLEDGNGKFARTLLFQPTLLSELVPVIGKLNLLRWERRIGTEPLEVEGVEGAAPVASRAAIEKAGLFDEDFFFYAEIEDWCLRIRRNGFKIKVIPNARMMHAREGSSREIGRPTKIEIKRARYLLIKKSLGGFAGNLVIGTDFLSGIFKVIFYAIGYLLSMLSWKRGYKKLVMYSGLLFWIAAGMPERSAPIYRKLFGKWG